MQKNIKKEGKPSIISHGVETLIERLKNEGVQAGKNEAEVILQQAQKEANKILNEARRDAKMVIDKSHHSIEQEKQAALDALKLALRDLRLELRQQLINRFKEEVKRLIHKELDNEATIRQLILLITADTALELKKFKENEITVQLPEKILDFGKIRENPKILKDDSLKQLVQGITSQMLQDGLSLKVNTDKHEIGMKVFIKGPNHEVEMDLSEDAINDLLLKHLQPRFRALLEGLLQ